MFQQRFLSIPSSNGDHYLPPCLCKPLLFRYYYPPTCKALLSPLKNTTSLHPIPAKLQPLPANTETLHTTHKFYKLQKEMTFILEGIPRRQCFSSFTDLKLTKCCHPIHFHSKTSSVEVQLRCMKQHFYSRQIALVWKVGMGTLTSNDPCKMISTQFEIASDKVWCSDCIWMHTCTTATTFTVPRCIW